MLGLPFGLSICSLRACFAMIRCSCYCYCPSHGSPLPQGAASPLPPPTPSSPPPSSASPPHSHSTSHPIPSLSHTPLPAKTTRQILEEIEGSIAHRFQLQLWKKEEATFRRLIDRKEEKYRTFQNEMYQVFAMYFVFQGVIFTGVAQSTILSCKDWWSPVSLSLIASLATICAVIEKLADIAKLKVDLQKTRSRAGAVYDKIDEMKRSGFAFDLDSEIESRHANREVGYCQIFSGYGIAVIVLLLTFSTFILVSCVIVLCRGCKCS